MMADNNAKATDNTNQDTEIDAETGAANAEAPSAVIGHLGLIKAMSVIMAVLIVAGAGDNHCHHIFAPNSVQCGQGSP
jgi:hypothetical protein